MRDLYHWYHDCEPYLRNVRSLANVGLVYSQRMVDHTLGGQRRQVPVRRVLLHPAHGGQGP